MWKCVQLVLPLDQVTHDLSLGRPPQTTSLPPDRRERLCDFRGSGKSGMEHVPEGGRGKSSTDESSTEPTPDCTVIPPTITCSYAKLIKHCQRYKRPKALSP